MASRQKRRLLAIASTAAEARARLAGLGPEVVVVGASAEELLSRDRPPNGVDAVWIADGFDAATIDALARGDQPTVVAGPGMGSVALATLAGRVRSEGRLVRLAVRSPGGRRQRPAASKRTPFGRDGLASWDLDPEDRARIAELAAPLWRAAETICPGSVERLGVSELIGGPKPRFVAHAIVAGVPVEIELDEEMRGDEAWEIEATFDQATLLARFDETRGVLLTRSPLRKQDSISDDRSADVLLARHALASPGTPQLGAAQVAIASRRALDAALISAPERLAQRDLGVVLVHVPRFRNRYDELMLPSLAIARLGAYLRGYGFDVRIADLEAMHADLSLQGFADDARVDAWLEGQEDGELSAKLEVLWATLAPSVRDRCLVGFSIVDYYGHFQMNLAACLARLVKRRTGQPTVLGGERDQVDGDRALRLDDAFDHVVDGDGERALHSLACLHADQDRDARFIEAVWSRRGEQTIKNRIVRSHLNAMPRPRFDGAPLDRYRRGPSTWLVDALREDGLMPEVEPDPSFYLPYGFVKGCVADCTFCSAKEHLDVQAPEKTVDELLALSEQHDTKNFVFLNNLVNLGPKWLERFCKRLIDAKADLMWTDSCRPTGIDEQLAAAMHEAGCLLLNFGAESGSDAILERMKKGLTRADIFSTLRATHSAGILNRVNLIAGYFHETAADVDLTISLVTELSEAIDVIGCFQGFYLFPGMGVDPASEDIVLREGLGQLETGQSTLMYDEIGGLRWEEKRLQINVSRDRILRAIEDLGIRTIDKIDEYDLFWLTRTFRDPTITARYVLRVPPAELSRVNQAALLPGGTTGRVG